MEEINFDFNGIYQKLFFLCINNGKKAPRFISAVPWGHKTAEAFTYFTGNQKWCCITRMAENNATNPAHDWSCHFYIHGPPYHSSRLFDFDTLFALSD